MAIKKIIFLNTFFHLLEGRLYLFALIPMVLGKVHLRHSSLNRKSIERFKNYTTFESLKWKGIKINKVSLIINMWTIIVSHVYILFNVYKLLNIKLNRPISLCLNLYNKIFIILFFRCQQRKIEYTWMPEHLC